MAAALFLYAFLSNVAVAAVPHEPGIIWSGGHLGVWTTALVATLGTLMACWVDQRLLLPVLSCRMTLPREGLVGAAVRSFGRAPMLAVAISGLTPLPFWPFKVLAHAAGMPLWRYLAAVAMGRLPRYLLLAWVGRSVPLPTWIISLACLVILLWGMLRGRWSNQPRALEAQWRRQ